MRLADIISLYKKKCIASNCSWYPLVIKTVEFLIKCLQNNKTKTIPSREILKQLFYCNFSPV